MFQGEKAETMVQIYNSGTANVPIYDGIHDHQCYRTNILCVPSLHSEPWLQPGDLLQHQQL